MSYIGTATEINALLASQKLVQLKSGKYYLNEPINIPSGGMLLGISLGFPLPKLYTELVVEEGNYPAVQFNGVINAEIRNLTITRLNPATSVDCNGIDIWGQSITVENININNAANGVYLKTDESIFNNQILLKDISFSNDPAIVNANPGFYSYGLQANTVNSLTVSNCNWQFAWLDGIKLRYKCFDVLIENGSSSKNGLSFGYWDTYKCINNRISDGIHCDSGDGIDCYAGGEYVTISGITLEENGGNGLVIKTKGGPLAQGSNEYCGQIKHYLISNITTKNNLGSGVVIEGVYDSISTKHPNLSNQTEDNRERASDITISNSQFFGDHGYGFFLNGTNILINNCEVISSCLQGIRIAENAKNLKIKDSRIISCCKRVLEDGVKLPAVFIEEKAEAIFIKNVFMDGRNNTLINPHIKYLHQNAIVLFEDANRISANNVRVINCTNLNSEGGEGTGGYRSPVSMGGNPLGGSVYIEHLGDKESPQGHIAAGLTSVYRYSIDHAIWLKLIDEDSRRVYGWVKQV